MIIRDVNLETVCGVTSKLPENTLPEFAFAGKSNVGKSSLINGLFIRPLISEDLPTLDLPEKATSGCWFSGSVLVIPHTVSRFTFFITILLLLPKP